MSTIKEGLEVDPENVDFITLMASVQKEIDEDTKLPADHPTRKRFNNLISWMEKGGADCSKLKLVFYTEFYRGVHAISNIKSGDTVLYVPLEQIITLEMAFKSPIG